MIFRIKKIFGRSHRTSVVLAIFGAAVLAAGFVSVALYRNRTSPVQRINYSALYAIAQTGPAASVLIENDSLTVTKTDGAVFQATVAGDSFRQTVVELFRRNGVPIEFASTQPGFAGTVFVYSWPVVICLVLGLVGWRVHATVNGRRGRSTLADHSGKHDGTFAAGAGGGEATAAILAAIAFLR